MLESAQHTTLVGASRHEESVCGIFAVITRVAGYRKKHRPGRCRAPSRSLGLPLEHWTVWGVLALGGALVCNVRSIENVCFCFLWSSRAEDCRPVRIPWNHGPNSVRVYGRPGRDRSIQPTSFEPKPNAPATTTCFELILGDQPISQWEFNIGRSKPYAFKR